MKISKLEYVRMQMSVLAASATNAHYLADVAIDSKSETAKKVVDSLLNFNGITVADEVEVKPFTQDEFMKFLENHLCIGSCNVDGMGWNELAERGLVV